jgi:hypothetical protein
LFDESSETKIVGGISFGGDSGCGFYRSDLKEGALSIFNKKLLV